MSLSDIVNVQITASAPIPTLPGFGIPLVLSPNMPGPNRATVLSSPSDLFQYGLNNSNSPEQRAVSALFAQSPAPSEVIMGRMAFKPTMGHTIALTSVVSGAIYKFTVTDQNGRSDQITYTALNTDTNDLIIAGLLAAWATVSGNYTDFTITSTGSVGSKVLTVAGVAAGAWYGLKVDNIDLLTLTQTTANGAAGSDVSADLAAIALENNDWYEITNLWNSSAIVQAIATWTETNNKLFIADVQDSACANTAQNGATDVANTVANANRARTAIVYHPDNLDMIAAAWAGKCLPFTPGQETWKFKQLSGPTAPSLTATHTTNLKAKRANYYTKIAGVSIMTEGIVAENEYIDVIRGRDWLVANMATDVFALLAASPKVPYTDAGIAMIEGVVRSVLDQAVGNNLLTSDPAPTVSVPKAASASTNDKANRVLNNVKFGGKLAGAIHSLNINGAVTP